MLVISKDMKELRDKANGERHKAKNEKKIVTMIQDKEWFKNECLALDTINKEQKKLLHQLKQNADILREEKSTIYKDLIEVKISNK